MDTEMGSARGPPTERTEAEVTYATSASLSHLRTVLMQSSSTHMLGVYALGSMAGMLLQQWQPLAMRPRALELHQTAIREVGDTDEERLAARAEVDACDLAKEIDHL